MPVFLSTRNLSANQPRNKVHVNRNGKTHTIHFPSPRSVGIESKLQNMIHTGKHNLKQVPKHQWTPSKSVGNCACCHFKFGLVFRKHHCRYCGDVVCGGCSTIRVQKKRICTGCLNKEFRSNTGFLLGKCYQCQEKIPRGQKICDGCTLMKLENRGEKEAEQRRRQRLERLERKARRFSRLKKVKFERNLRLKQRSAKRKANLMKKSHLSSLRNNRVRKYSFKAVIKDMEIQVDYFK